MEREYNDLIGDMLAARGEKGAYEGKGKGQPLSKEYMKMDTYQHFQKIARENGFVPEWIKLQREIGEKLALVSEVKELKSINKLIKKHNGMCPPPMQKPPVDWEGIDRARLIWQ